MAKIAEDQDFLSDKTLTDLRHFCPSKLLVKKSCHPILTDTIQLIDLEKITSPRAKRSSLIKNQNLIIEERCIKPKSSNGVLQQPIKYSEITKIGFGFTEFSKPYILMQLSPRNHKHHVSKIYHILYMSRTELAANCLDGINREFDFSYSIRNFL